MKVETIKVKPAHPSQGDHVVINKADFDPAIHERIEKSPRTQSEQPKKEQPTSKE